MNKLFTAALISTTVITLASAGSANAVVNAYIGTSDGSISTVDLVTRVATPFVNIGLGSTIGDLAISNDGSTIFVNSLGAAGGNDNLYKIDLATNVVSLVGSQGIANLAGLTTNFSTDELYGTSFASGNTPGGFSSVNKTTGAATLIANIPGFSAAGDLTYFPSINGFYATSTTPTNSTLFSIALNGAATQIGSIGFTDVFGLIRNNGILYGFTANGQQLTIDTTTGVGTLLGSVTGLPSNTQILGSTGAAVPEPLTILGSVFALGLGTSLKRKLKSK